MEGLPSSIVAEAFALSRARGADLLLRLGDFDVWEGDLTEMRGDSPRSRETPKDGNEAPAKARFCTDILIMARALNTLQPVCRDALAARYVDYRDSGSLARDVDMTNCEKRLLEAYLALKDADATAPAIASGSPHRK